MAENRVHQQRTDAEPAGPIAMGRGSRAFWTVQCKPSGTAQMPWAVIVAGKMWLAVANSIRKLQT